MALLDRSYRDPSIKKKREELQAKVALVMEEQKLDEIVELRKQIMGLEERIAVLEKDKKEVRDAGV